MQLTWQYTDDAGKTQSVILGDDEAGIPIKCEGPDVGVTIERVMKARAAMAKLFMPTKGRTYDPVYTIARELGSVSEARVFKWRQAKVAGLGKLIEKYPDLGVTLTAVAGLSSIKFADKPGRTVIATYFFMTEDMV